jgi:hypothetical protein
MHNDSCHPIEYKNSAVRYLINRMNTYPISTERKHCKLQLIKTILQNNKYPPQTYLNTTKQSKNIIPNTIQKQKLATFTFIGKETITITRLFKNTNIRIAYKTKNKIQIHLLPRKHDTDKYNNSGLFTYLLHGLSP